MPSEKPIAQKMLIKPGYTILIVNAPPTYTSKLGKLPSGAKILSKPGSGDVIQAFVALRSELEQELPRLKTFAKPGGSTHAYAKTIGLIGVAMIAIDDDWAAMRFKTM